MNNSNDIDEIFYEKGENKDQSKYTHIMSQRKSYIIDIVEIQKYIQHRNNREQIAHAVKLYKIPTKLIEKYDIE
ncbi:hypothetical protein Smp_000560 [Schistosoma mansoni]|uniref:HTH psq-type domain-containing protein n=1 Tax=Schistosoma mansoni TaxID=6183 RepID=G4LYH7_SCHMA|nr:hypothetical protein Smp_000560 [Schistosoma mansoni]|eukprot:XP_018646311.1 hypothetical protein Smp_000560 [Schistosoma mansoni]